MKPKYQISIALDEDQKNSLIKVQEESNIKPKEIFLLGLNKLLADKK